MAIPTITAVSPNTGVSQGGDLILITGTGFPTPAIPVALPTPDVYPSVSVMLGSASAEVVRVLSATELIVRTPDYEDSVRASAGAVGGPVPYNAFPAVAVVLQNLDANGTPVPGESATLASGFQFIRRALGPPRSRGVYKRIQDQVMEWLRRNVCKTVSTGRNSEYADGAEIDVRLAALPGIGVVCVFEEDPGWSQFTGGLEEVVDPTDATRVLVYDGMRARQARVRLLYAGQTYDQCLELSEALEDAVERQGYMVMDADPDLYPGESDRYPMFWAETPRVASRGADTDVTHGHAALLIRGFLLMSDAPRERAWTVSTFEVEEVGMDGGPLRTTTT